MTPPEPPTPTPSNAYTYDSVSKVIGYSYGNFYTNIRHDGVLCEVVTTYQPVVFNFTSIYQSNGSDGLASGYYPAQFNDGYLYVLNHYVGHVVRWDSSDYEFVDVSSYNVTSSSPSDYYSNVTSNDITLEEYQ